MELEGISTKDVYTKTYDIYASVVYLIAKYYEMCAFSPPTPFFLPIK
jgi:hypothetical protein